MSHWILIPILLPLFTGLALLIWSDRICVTRAISATSALALLAVDLLLLQRAAEGTISLYALGNWPPPFGIVLVLDRLAALMLVMTSVLALFVIWYAACDRDQPGDSLHPLIHFLLMGLNGAFLTGDIFNLFVFFEVLLLSSYALLLHGGGKERARAGFHYVVLNLAGSALFLIAVSLLYGVTGTLNMADMGQRIAQLDPADRSLAITGGLLLFAVFGLKAAVAPLYFWLPSAYAAAAGPVAALFAVMTKLGIYSMVRVYSLVFASEPGLLLPWLWPLALVTLAAGIVGVLAARELRRQVAYLVLVSVGTLLLGVAMNSQQALAASLYYLVHSTWICAALFILVDLMRQQRGLLEDTIESGPPLVQGTILGIFFFVACASVVGLPPTSGFVGKVNLMQAVSSTVEAVWVWPALLISGLLTITALSRSGTTIFWRTTGDVIAQSRAGVMPMVAVGGLLLISIVFSFAGDPVLSFMSDTAQQLADSTAYLEASSLFQPVERGDIR